MVLAGGFRELGFNSRLLASDRQLKMLFREFSPTALEGAIEVKSRLQFELDGPERGVPSKQVICEPSQLVARFVAESVLCVSDNGVWPQQFAYKGAILANFLWSEYWESRSEESPKIDRQKILEKEIAGMRRRRLANPGVSVVAKDSMLPIHSTVPFLRYPGDSSTRQKLAGKTIWIAGGTTQIEKEWLSGIKVSFSDYGFNVLERETWSLSKCEELPAAVIGRPGLGSIRDSISAGIPFIPSFSDLEDPEMKTNAKFLAGTFWGMPDYFANPTDIGRSIELVNEVLRQSDFWRERFKSKWLSLSGEPAALAEKLLLLS